MTKTRNTSRHAHAAKKVQQKSAPPPREIPWFWIGIVAMVVVSLALILVYRGFENRAAGERDNTTQALPATITVTEANEKYQQGALMLDVREQSEWDEYHIPNATLIPLGELASRVSELPQDQEIVVVCRTGNRSLEGRDILKAAGFEQVTSMDGGMVDWRAASYPVATGP